MNGLAQRYLKTQSLIGKHAQESGRALDSIRLLAVSKTRPPEDILQLYQLGQLDFGENYLQEALAKQDRLSHLNIQWHFIGPVQSNKTRAIAERFQWLHTLDRIKIAQRLSQQRPEHMPPLNVCIQINLDDEASKSGIAFEQLPELVERVCALPRLKLRGLMAIPAPDPDHAVQLHGFKRLSDALSQLNTHFQLQLDTLSMGMSGDLEAAIEAGSSMVRIGTAIFGPRAARSTATL